MLTFHKSRYVAGNRIEVDVSRGNEPFGQMWSYRNTRTERHPWHAKPLNGEAMPFTTKTEAMAYMRRAEYRKSADES